LIDAFFEMVMEHTFQANALGDLSELKSEEIEDKKLKIRQDLATGGKERFFLLAEYQGQIIGTIEHGLSSDLLRECTNHELSAVPEIGTVFVCPEYQRQGVFQELRRTNVEEVCLDSGYKEAQKIWVHIFGEPAYFLKDFWSQGNHHMVWRVKVEEMLNQWNTEASDIKDVLDRGPFFHGTKAELQIGDLLAPQYLSNFQDKKSNYIYFTATLDAAKWGAELSEPRSNKSRERIYVVEPFGDFENDPNLTDKRFPGNPTRSYRSKSPLKIIAELGSWERHSEEQINNMHASLRKLREDGKAVIID
jgi:rifampin ADP-ribosylating transferase